MTSRYEQLRQCAAEDRARKIAENPQFSTTGYDEDVAGIRFGLLTIRQSYNGANAVQVLHYVDGKKVSKALFVAQLNQLCCAQ